MADALDVPELDDPGLDQTVDTAVLLTSELAENAVLHAGTDFEVAVVVSDTEIVVTVSDRGDGFAPELVARLGRPVQSTKGPGHGVGLFLTANVARKLGGRMEVENRVGSGGRGAAVTLVLPLAMIGANEASLRWMGNADSSS